MDESKKQERQASVKSSILKCGKSTYFFDVNLASNKRKYLKVTESRFVGDAGERKRSSFVLFPEDAKNFQQRLTEIATYLN